MGRTAFSSSSQLLAPYNRAFDGAPLVKVADSILKTVASYRNTTNTPNWARFKDIYAVSINDKPMNPFAFYREVVLGGEGYLTESNALNPAQYVVESGHFSSVYGDTTGGVILEPTTDQLNRMSDLLDNQLLGKLKNSSVNLAVVFAERKRTADLIGDTAIKLANSMRALKKGKIRDAAAALKVGVSNRKVQTFNRQYYRNKERAISGAWLELQYGWKPLLQDIYGSAEFLAKKQAYEKFAVVKSLVKRKYEYATKSPASPDYFDVYRYGSSKFDYSGMLVFTTVGAELVTPKEAGLLNPLSVAWELVPYSFVVDWFLPVGNYLDALDATIGLEFRKGQKTTFLKGESSIILAADGRRAANRYYAQSIFNCRIRSSRTKVEVHRYPQSGFPGLHLPSFKNPFSFLHSANAIALLFQSFKR